MLWSASKQDYQFSPGETHTAPILSTGGREGLCYTLPPSEQAASGLEVPSTCFLPHCFGQEGAWKGAGATSGAGFRPVLAPMGELVVYQLVS